MNIAFSILSHRPPGTVFLKLLDFLQQFENAIIVVHHDYTQSTFPEDVIEKYKLIMVKDYANTGWGHVTKIPAILKTFRDIYALKPEIDWVITVSPNCYPIKSANHIKNFLKEATVDCYMNHDKIQLDSWEVPNSHFITLFTRPIIKIPFFSKKGKFYWRYIRKNIDIEKTPFNSSYTPYCGSDWMIFNNKTLKLVLDGKLETHPTVPFITEANSFPDRNASPIEIIIQSYILNHKEISVEFNYHRFIDWKGAQQWHPNTLDMKYYDRIASSDALFGRKFTDEKSLPLLERIDKELLTK